MSGYVSGRTSLTTVQTGNIAADAVTLAKMAAGTDGNIISYDTSGDPVAVSTGSDGQVLTSSGAGTVCAFEDAAGGKTIKRYYVEDRVYATTSSGIPGDDTIPQITEGAQSVTLTTDTLASSSNRIRCTYGACMSLETGGYYYALALFNGASSAIDVAGRLGGPNASYFNIFAASYEYAPGATTALVISTRYGTSDSQTVNINGNTARVYGGGMSSYLIVEEIEP
jgi:hypothetical protein